MNEDSMRRVLRVTKALADGPRLRILMMLRDGECCVCQITEVLQLAASTVSKHLSILHEANLVECRKDGRWMHYRLARRARAGFASAVQTWLVKSLAEDATVGRDRQRLATVTACEIEEICKRQRNANKNETGGTVKSPLKTTRKEIGQRERRRERITSKKY